MDVSDIFSFSARGREGRSPRCQEEGGGVGVLNQNLRRGSPPAGGGGGWGPGNFFGGGGGLNIFFGAEMPTKILIVYIYTHLFKNLKKEEYMHV